MARRRRTAFKYIVRRFFLVVFMLALVALPVWFFAGKPQPLEWPFGGVGQSEESVSASQEESAAEPEEPSGPAESQLDSEPESDPVPALDTEPDSAPKDNGDGAWSLLLVNSENFLPEGYGDTIELATITDSYRLDARIAENVMRMFADAKSSGVTLVLTSAYRSAEKQEQLYEEKVQEYISAGDGEEEAQAVAATIVARPGTSEHSTGLAMDIITPSYTNLDEGFADTPAFKWLDENAHKYGFVLRFPKDKQEITGIIYEPWHYRYVGEEHAARIKQGGLCLEEYVGELSAARPETNASPEEPGEESPENPQGDAALEAEEEPAGE